MLDYIVSSLRENYAQLDNIAADTEISRWTLLKIVNRQIKNPGIKSVEPLYLYFKKREGKSLRRRAEA